MSYVKNIAIVGASGQVGGQILQSLLQAKDRSFNITVLSRKDSKATFSDDKSITVKKGDYTSEFLESALKGQEVLIITLAVTADLDIQTDIIKAAAKVGVPWILPNEFGSDGLNEELSKAVMILGIKGKYRAQIEELGKSSWIGIANNPWFDFSLKGGFFGIDISARKATIYDDGKTPINTTSLPQVGRAVAKLLSLPVQSSSSSSSSASLSDFKNNYVYITSFVVSQNEILAAVQRATRTKPDDWTVTKMPVDEYLKDAYETASKGELIGMVQVLYGSTFKKGLGNLFHGRDLSNEKLGLDLEDLGEVTEGVVREVEAEVEAGKS